MARYAADVRRTASTTASVGSLGAGATARRISLYLLAFGSEAAPADQALLWELSAVTALGTSTAVTPKQLDIADAAALAAAGENHTVEPTYAGSPYFNIALNQKATWLWQSLPELGIVAPATTGSGWGIRTPTITSGTPVVTAQMHFVEH